MKLAHWYRASGHDVVTTRKLDRQNDEGPYDLVYGSAIFSFSAARVAKFTSAWPAAIVGGTGTSNTVTVEDVIGASSYEFYDYAGYPDFRESIGFTQRGCRLKCKFCVVPTKEGKPRSVNAVSAIWRGAPYPKKIHVLDNDFFGQPSWRDRIAELRDGQFRICLSQGINVRLIDDEAAAALATIEYRDTKFVRRRLYTAWDNLGDENIFFRGVDTLQRAGIPAKHLMAYMLIGFDRTETWDRIWHRFQRMVSRGIKPYPMVYDRQRTDLLAFQRWVITGLYRLVPWNQYRRETKSQGSVTAWLNTGVDLV